MRPTLLAVVPALCVVVSGCSDDDTDPAAAPSTSATSTPSAGATDGVISPPLPDLPEFTGTARGAIGDVQVEECDTEPGEVEASGTATNSAASRRDLVVVMDWTVGSTGDVVARAVATLEDLEPGESASWRAEARVPGDVTAACVPTALAGRLKD